MADNRRVQVDPLQANIRLQPAAAPVDTYAAPARPPQDNNLNQLAQSLASFSNSLGGLQGLVGKGSSDAANNKAAVAQLQETNQETAARFRKDGVPMTGEEKQDAYNGATAAEAVFSNDEEAWDQYAGENLDWSAEDAERERIKFQQERIQANAKLFENPSFTRAYTAAALKKQRIVREQQVKYQAEKRVEDTSNNYQSNIDRWIVNDDPAIAVKAVMDENLEAAGPRGALNLPEDQRIGGVLLAAERHSGTRPENVLAILNAPYKDDQGRTFTLATHPQYRDKAIAIQQLAKKAQFKKEETAFLAKVDQDNTTRLSEGKGLHDLQPITYKTPEGTTKTVTVEEQRTAAEGNYFTQSKARAARDKESEHQTILREARETTNLQVENKALKSRLKGIGSRMSPAVMQDPQAKAQLITDLEAAEAVGVDNKGALISATSEEDRNSVTAYSMLKRYKGMDTDQAAAAVYQMNNPDSQAKSRMARQSDKLDRMVSTEFKGDSVAYDKAMKLSTMFVATGSTPAEAIELSKAALKASSITYNGTVIDLGVSEVRVSLPSEEGFTRAVDNEITTFKDLAKVRIKNGEYDPDNAIPRQFGTDGRFILVDKTTQQPLKVDDGSIYKFTLNTVRNHDARYREVEKQNALRRASVDRRLGEKGLTSRLASGGVETFVDKNNQIYELIYPEGAKRPEFKATGKRMSPLDFGIPGVSRWFSGAKDPTQISDR